MVTVVRTGTANMASVLAALTRLGVTPVVAHDAATVARAARVILPGVGAFGASMAELVAADLVAPLRDRLASHLPTLAICMGLQLLCEGSDETPGVIGIGAVSGKLQRFATPVRVPQLGWNQVAPVPGCRVVKPGYAYFAHSYRLADAPAGWHAAYTEHGERYVSALEQGPVVLCQFHPELSGSWGRALLTRWLTLGDPKEAR